MLRAALLLATTALLLGGFGPGAQAATRSCPSLSAQAGKATKIRATGVTCTTARKIVRAWQAADKLSDECTIAEECDVRGYACTPGRESGRIGVLRITCRREARKVGWTQDTPGT